MPAKIYALLAGINDYPSNVGSLSGCVNDVDAVHGYLRRRFPAALQAEILTNADATRQNLIDQFRRHLARAGAEDVVLFHYSGHGARWKSAGQFQHLYPGGMDEGLVCVDSRTPGGYDLADKELAILLSEVARNCPHIAVVLDCCHSGSGTRTADDFTQLRCRQTHEVSEERPLESYLDGYYENLHRGGKPLDIPASRHILMAACHRTQKAWETREHRGVFTTALQQALERSGESLSYADLFVRARTAVRELAENQEPQFETYRGFHAYQGFLDTGSAHSPRRYRVAFENNHWKLNCGALHGLPADPDEAVEVALYAESNPSAPAGRAVTTQVGPQSSELTLQEWDADPAEAFQAEITSLPVPPLAVTLSGEEAGTAAIQEFLVANQDESLGLEFTEGGSAGARYVLSANDGRFLLKSRATDQLIQGAVGYTRESADYLFAVLKRIAAWERAIGLQNHWTQLDSGLVPFQLCEASEDAEVVREFPGPEVTVDITKVDGEWSVFRGMLKAKNLAQQPLNLLLVHLSSDYGIQPLYNEWIEPTQSEFTVTLDGNSCFDLVLEEDEGDETVHTFRLIVSTERVDDFLLAQDPLKMGLVLEADASTGTRGLKFGSARKKVARQNDWFVREIQVRLVRQLDVIAERDVTLANGQIKILGHPELRAGIGLSATESGARGTQTGMDMRRALKRQGLAPLNFAGTRGDHQSVLELTDIQNPRALQTQPLEIELDVDLADDECIVPLTFDGEDLLLAGECARDAEGRVRVSISRIPDVPDQRRGIGKSLKLYFFKNFLRRGVVNQLRRVEYKPNGAAEQHSDGVAEHVAAATNILVLIHGELGDSADMLRSLPLARDGQGRGVHERFDLVLTYDYESLSTPIPESALTFQQQLKEVGIHATDGKRVSVAAHSLGGLITRWMIEQIDGRQFIDHLAMFGTPNQGAPLGNIGAARNVVTLLTTVGMSLNPVFATIGGALIYLLNGSEKPTVTLEQMSPHSSVVQALSVSDDPRVAYTIVCGSFAECLNQGDERLGRLLAKVGGQSLLDSLHGGGAHDIFVGCASAFAVDEDRQPPPQQVNVPCHHLSYFESDAGLAALASISW